MHILIVEDSDIQAALLTKTLEKVMEKPLEIQRADTLQKAIAVLKGQDEGLDLVFLDLGLPDSEDWYETYRSVLPFMEKLPVIVMTSNKSPEVIQEMMKQGIQDYIVKGSKKHDAELLKETIEFALLRHKKVSHLSTKVEEKDQAMHWLTGGYSMRS
jgi:DNA-binding NtrC family response regulator